MTLSPDQRDRLLLLDRAHGVQELLRGLAHDIRNHLQVLALASQLGDASRTPDIDRRVEEAIEEINHDLDLLGAWGRHEAEAAATPLPALVSTAARAADYQRNYPSAPVRWASPPECEVAIPSGAALQVLLDLVANAKEASPAGQAVEIGFARNSDGLVIEIADRGAGIEGEPAPLESSRPAASHGGIGRFAAQAIARAHGGTVEWRARDGGGTVARVTLRLAY